MNLIRYRNFDKPPNLTLHIHLVMCYYFKQKDMKNIKFREQNRTILGKLFSFFGIELNRKYEIGKFHQFGYSGKQKNDKHDIIIIEKNNGYVATIPNKEKYYKFIN